MKYDDPDQQRRKLGAMLRTEGCERVLRLEQTDKNIKTEMVSFFVNCIKVDYLK